MESVVHERYDKVVISDISNKLTLIVDDET